MSMTRKYWKEKSKPVLLSIACMAFCQASAAFSPQPYGGGGNFLSKKLL